MYKIILTLGISSLFIGCANFQITGMMCDQVRVDPHATIPSECRPYSEKEAQKAFEKENKVLSTEDVIKYTK